MVSLFDVVYIGAPTLLFITEWRWKLVSKVTDRLDAMWIIRPGFSIYNLFSFFFLIGTWIFFLIGLPQLLAQGNPLIEYYWNGHWLSWVALAVVISRHGYFNIIKGLYAGAFVYAVHELSWIGLAGVFYNAEAVVYAHYWVAIAVMSIMLIGYMLAFRALPLRTEILIVAVILTWDALWVAAGFHSSVANWFPDPKTIFFTDPNVNVLETLSWLIPSLIALL